MSLQIGIKWLNTWDRMKQTKKDKIEKRINTPIRLLIGRKEWNTNLQVVINRCIITFLQISIGLLILGIGIGIGQAS